MVTAQHGKDERRRRLRQDFAVQFGMAGGIPFGAMALQLGNWWWVAGTAAGTFLFGSAIYIVKTWRLMTAGSSASAGPPL